jgi:hypothetical protein
MDYLSSQIFVQINIIYFLYYQNLFIWYASRS